MTEGGLPMPKTVLAAAVVLSAAAAAAAAAAAQDHASCPMMSKAAEHRAGVDHRHDAAAGVSHDASVHHFLLAPDGGTIRLEATRDAPADRDQIRMHLRHVARSFADGNFELPMLIHDQVPPGVAVMKTKKAAIQYAFSETENGGEVRITTRDGAALAAVHDFLRFQIDDHGTGDAKE
jgi:hypothetical protein